MFQEPYNSKSYFSHNIFFAILKMYFVFIEKASNIIEMNCIQMHLMPTFNSQLPAFGGVLYQGRALEHSHLTPYFVLGAYTGKLFYNTKSVKVSF